jgi:hypothetical protein
VNFIGDILGHFDVKPLSACGGKGKARCTIPRNRTIFAFPRRAGAL